MTTYTPLRDHLKTYTAGENYASSSNDTSYQDRDSHNVTNQTQAARSHLESYTFGEEKSRLEHIAESFGLARVRKPRKSVHTIQNFVRKHAKKSSVIPDIFQDSTFETAGLFIAGISYQGEEDTESNALISIDEEVEAGSLISLDSNRQERMLSMDGSLLDGVDEEDQTEKVKSFGGSLSASVFGTVKGLVGATILYFPHGFSTSGYAFALPCMFFITSMYLYTSGRLLDCWKKIVLDDSEEDPTFEIQKLGPNSKIMDESKNLMRENGKDLSIYGTLCTSSSSISEKDKNQHNSEPNDIPDTNQAGEKSQQRHPLSYPELAYLAYGRMGECGVRTGIALMQIGHMLTYLIFIAQSLRHTFFELMGKEIPFWVFVLFNLFVDVPLTWIRDVRKLTTTNIVALLLVMFGVISCFIYAFSIPSATYENNENFIQRFSEMKAINNSWYLFIGTCIFLFQGSITLCIPFQEAVEGKEERKKFPKIYKRTIMTCMIILNVFSLVCWNSFGPTTVQIVLLNSLPEGQIFPSIVRFLYSIAIMFSFPLIGFPAFEIICHACTPYLEPSITSTTKNMSQSKLSFKKRAYVTSIVCIFIALVGLIEMDNLGHVVSLIGSVLGCPIVFILPPLIHNKLVLDSNAVKSGNEKERFSNMLVSLLGTCMMMFLTFTTLYTWNSQEAAV